MDDTLCMNTELLAEQGMKLQQISDVLRSVEVPVGAQGDVELHCPAPCLSKVSLIHGSLDTTAKSYLHAISALAEHLHMLSFHVLIAAERFEDVERRLFMESGDAAFCLFAALAGDLSSEAAHNVNPKE